MTTPRIIRKPGSLSSSEENVLYMAVAIATDRLGGLTFTREEYAALVRRQEDRGEPGLRIRSTEDGWAMYFERTPGDA